MSVDQSPAFEFTHTLRNIVRTGGSRELDLWSAVLVKVVLLPQAFLNP